MSSAGLRSMLLIYRAAKAKDAKVVLAGINKDIRSSMSATGFLTFFVLARHRAGRPFREMGMRYATYRYPSHP